MSRYEQICLCPYQFIFLQLTISFIGGQTPPKPGQTVQTRPNLNLTQNGDPRDSYREYEGRNKHDKLGGVAERFCKSLRKIQDMTVRI